MFWNLILFAVSFIASALLAPKPKIENARAANLTDFSFPRSDEASAVPLVLGRGLLTGPNTLWYGDFKAVQITDRVKVSLFKKKTIIVGHRYFLGLDLCFAMGPVTLHKVLSGDEKVIYDTDLPSSTAVNISLKSLLGGHKKGGGLAGTMRFYSGDKTEARNDYIYSKLDDDQKNKLPNYRGFSRCVFEAFEFGESPSILPISFLASMYPDPLALGTKNKIGDDLNPATILFYLLSSRWGGLGLPNSIVHIGTFQALGDLLYAENHGASLVLGQSAGARDFIEEVLRQIDAVIFENAATRQIEIKAIRGGYDVDTLPSFSDDETLEVVSYTRGMWNVTQNEVRVNYTAPSRNFKPATAIAQDMAAIGRSGVVRSVEFAFPACHDSTLAQSLAQRELRQITTPLIKCRLILNREAGKLQVGDVFVYSNADYGLSGLVLRVERADRGTLDDGRIALDCTQDVFSVGELVFAAPDDSVYEPPSNNAEPAAPGYARFAPRFLVERLDADDYFANAEDPALVYMATQPTQSHTHFDSELDGEIVDENLQYAESATLAADISEVDRTITIVGSSWLPVTVLDPAKRDGEGIVLVGGVEWMQFGDVTDNGDGTFDLTVDRSLFQTPPLAHAAGVAVQLLDAADAPMSNDQLDPALTGVTAKILTRTFSDDLQPNEAPALPITFGPSATPLDRPSSPRFATQGGDVSPAATEIVLDWANRDAKGKTEITLPSDPNETPPADVLPILEYWPEGQGAASVTKAHNDVTHTIPLGSLSETKLYARIKARMTLLPFGTVFSEEFDQIVFNIPVRGGGGGVGPFELPPGFPTPLIWFSADNVTTDGSGWITHLHNKGNGGAAYDMTPRHANKARIVSPLDWGGRNVFDLPDVSSGGYQAANTAGGINSFATVTTYKDGADDTFDSFDGIVSGLVGSEFEVVGKSGTDQFYGQTDRIYIDGVRLANPTGDSVLPMLKKGVAGVNESASSATNFGTLWSDDFASSRNWKGICGDVLLFDSVLIDAQVLELDAALRVYYQQTTTTDLYWSLNCRTGANSGYFGIAEIVFYDHLGEAISTTGETVFSSSDRPSFEDDFAFDGDTLTRWSAIRTGANPEHIGVQFTNPTGVVSMHILPRLDSNWYQQAPTGFELRHSSDGIAWTDTIVRLAEPAWTRKKRWFGDSGAVTPLGLADVTGAASSSAFAVKGTILTADADLNLTEIRFSNSGVASSGLLVVALVDGSDVVTSILAEVAYTSAGAAEWLQVALPENINIVSGQAFMLAVVRNDSGATAHAGVKYCDNAEYWGRGATPKPGGFRLAKTTLDVGDINGSPSADPWMIDYKARLL